MKSNLLGPICGKSLQNTRSPNSTGSTKWESMEVRTATVMPLTGIWITSQSRRPCLWAASGIAATLCGRRKDLANCSFYHKTTHYIYIMETIPKTTPKKKVACEKFHWKVRYFFELFNLCQHWHDSVGIPQFARFQVPIRIHHSHRSVVNVAARSRRSVISRK